MLRRTIAKHIEEAALDASVDAYEEGFYDAAGDDNDADDESTRERHTL